MSIAERVLWFLRIYGPISNRDLAAKAGLDRAQTYLAIGRLAREGFAARVDREAYDVTLCGRAFLERRQQQARRLTPSGRCV